MTKNVQFATFTQTVMIRTYCSTPEVHQTSSKAGSGINILYSLTGPLCFMLQEKISHVKGKMGASGREFDDRNRNMKEVVGHYSFII